MKISKYIALMMLFLVPVLSIKANSFVSQGDSAYHAGDYRKAIELYNQAATDYGVSAPLLFNLGNAYLQQDDYGNAMLCYQKAKKLDPSSKRINTNLKYLTGKIEDANKAVQKGKRLKVTEDTPNFFQTVHASVSENTSSNTWAVWAAGSFLLFSACVVLYLFTSNVLMRKTGFFGGFILLGISIICLVCAYSAAAVAQNHDYGVILPFKTVLLTEPGKTNPSDKNEGILTRGTKLRIVAEETDAEGNVSWYKVRLNSDYIGWVEAKDIGII